MAMPTYDEWIKGTEKTAHSRSTKLKAVDSALAAYVGNPKAKPPIPASQTRDNLRAIEKALGDWQDSKADWANTIRDRKGMITRLVDALKQEKAGKIGGVSTFGVGGAVVPRELASQIARDVKTREAMISLESARFSIDTHQKLIYPVGAYPSEVPPNSGNWVANTAPVTKEFDWTAVFEMTLRRKQLEVTVNVRPTVADVLVGGKFQSTWKTHIQSAWKGARLKTAGNDIYDIVCTLSFVGDDHPHCYQVEVSNPPPPPVPANWREAQRRRAEPTVGTNVGTPHMAQWGGSDSAAISHEYGHMLGLPDEYYTVEWNHAAVPNDVYNQVPFTTDSLMNNTGPDGRIFKRHYEVIRRCFENWRGLPANSVDVIVTG